MTVGDLFPHRLVHAVVVAAGVVDQELLLLFQTRVGDGNSAQQSLGVGVQGMEEQLFSLCQLHDAALADDGDAVRDESDDRQVVGDEQVGQTAGLLHAVQQVQHLRTDGDVQCRDGLVGHDELRLHDQRTGDADTLTLTARELVGEAGGELRQQADLVQSVHDLFVQVILVLVQVVVQQTLSHDVLDLGALVQRGHGVLEDHLHLADDLTVQLLGDLAVDLLALEEDVAARGRVDAADGTANGGLAGAGLADQREGFSI